MTLARWASTNRRVRTPAMARSLLEGMPGGPNIAVPMRFIDRASYESKVGNRQLNQLIDSAPVVERRLDQLTAIQHTVKKDRVMAYIDKPNLRRAGTRDPVHGGLVDLPIVVRMDGVDHLHDGHHRVTAAKLLGEPSIKVRFVDLDREQLPL
jgi:hypothetical protein